MVIHQFQPAWDLQAYLRFTSLAYTLHNSSYPSYDSTGLLPQVQHDGRLVGQRKAMDYLRDYAKASVPKETLGERVIDGTLRSEQRAEAVAYAAMLQDTLRNALLYAVWSDTKRYEASTRRLVKGAMLAPLKWLVPGLLRKDFVAYLDVAGINQEKTAVFEANKCYRALEVKLGERVEGEKKRFLFGDLPSYVDALLFGHIAVAKDEPLLNTMLLEKCPNILAHFEFIRDRFFQDIVSGVGSLAVVGLNHFEEAAGSAILKVPAPKKAPGAGAGRDAGETVDVQRERWWRYGIISLGAAMLAGSVWMSRKRP